MSGLPGLWSAFASVIQLGAVLSLAPHEAYSFIQWGTMMRGGVIMISVAAMLWVGYADGQWQSDAQRTAMIAREQAAEISDGWTPPPGDPLTHFTVAYAKLMCSAVFVSGLDSDYARQTFGDSNALTAAAHPKFGVRVRTATTRPEADRQF